MVRLVILGHKFDPHRPTKLICFCEILMRRRPAIRTVWVDVRSNSVPGMKLAGIGAEYGRRYDLKLGHSSGHKTDFREQPMILVPSLTFFVPLLYPTPALRAVLAS